MPPADDTHGIDQVDDVLELPRRLECGATEAGEAAHVKARQAPVAGGERDAGNPNLRRKILGGIELEPFAAEPRVPDTEFVDHARREDVGLADHRVAGVVGPVAGAELRAGQGRWNL